MAKEILVLSPFAGEVKELSVVEDPVFAGEMIGKGFAVAPKETETVAVSPVVKGKVALAFGTGHAYGVATKGGPELLIHIGIDTVTLDGKGFDAQVAQGSKLKEGTPLVNVDLKTIAKEAPSTDTMVLVTNETLGDWTIERVAGKTVEAGEVLFKLVK